MVRKSLAEARRSLLSESVTIPAADESNDYSVEKIPHLKVDYGSGLEDVNHGVVGDFPLDMQNTYYDFVDNTGTLKGFEALAKKCEEQRSKIVSYINSPKFASRIQKAISRDAERDRADALDYRKQTGVNSEFFIHKTGILDIKADTLKSVKDVAIRIIPEAQSKENKEGELLMGEYLQQDNAINIYMGSIHDTSVKSQIFDPLKKITKKDYVPSNGALVSKDVEVGVEFRISTPGNPQPQKVKIKLVKYDLEDVLQVVLHELLHAFSTYSMESLPRNTFAIFMDDSVRSDYSKDYIRELSSWNSSELVEIIDKDADISSRVRDLGLTSTINSLNLAYKYRRDAGNSNVKPAEGIQALKVLHDFISSRIVDLSDEDYDKGLYMPGRGATEVPLSQPSHVVLAYRMLRGKADDLGIQMSMVTTSSSEASRVLNSFEPGSEDRRRVAMLLPMLKSGPEADVASSAVAVKSTSGSTRSA